MRIGFVTSQDVLGRDREIPNLLAAATAAGFEAEVVCWEACSACEDFDLLITRSTWNYIAKLEEFLAWARLFRGNDQPGGGPVLLNPEAMIRWNCHKRYLEELARHSIPVVESSLVTTLAELLACAQHHDRVVAKPAVGGGALGCSRFRSADLPAAAKAFDTAAAAWPEVIVQPYLDSIEDVGEISLVVIDGKIVQGLRKSPADGGWRVQREWGGTVADADVSPEHRGLAEACFSYVSDRCGTRPLYMRVDLMADSNGRPLVSEIELIEPVLYADVYPEVAAQLVAALAANVLQ